MCVASVAIVHIALGKQRKSFFNLVPRDLIFYSRGLLEDCRQLRFHMVCLGLCDLEMSRKTRVKGMLNHKNKLKRLPVREETWT